MQELTVLHNVPQFYKQPHKAFAVLINGPGKQSSHKLYLCLRLNYVQRQLMYQHTEQFVSK